MTTSDEGEYNRAFIVRNEISAPLLALVDVCEDSHRWLYESKESFHGRVTEGEFRFRDSRIDSRLSLPLCCVELEF
jgi:hypothetical protein